MHQLNEMFIRLLPVEVENRLRMLHDVYQSPRTLLKITMSIEGELKRTGLSKAVVVHYEEQGEGDLLMDQMFPGLPPSTSEAPSSVQCFNCAEPHFRSKCPYRPNRCKSCGGLNHISMFCDRAVFADKSAKTRAIVTPKRDAYNIDLKLDNSSTEQLTTMAANIQRLIQSRQTTNDKFKDRGRRLESKSIQGPLITCFSLKM